MDKVILTTNDIVDIKMNQVQVRNINGEVYVAKELILLNGNNSEKVLFTITMLKADSKYCRKFKYGLYSQEKSKAICQHTRSYYNILSTKEITFEHYDALAAFIKNILFDICEEFNYLMDCSNISAEQITESLIIHFKNK